MVYPPHTAKDVDIISFSKRNRW